MPFTVTDHVNLHTNRLDAMIDWYCSVLGLTPGERPPFKVDGNWLYLREEPMVRLVEIDGADGDVSPPGPGHVSFSATDTSDLLETLKARGIPYTISPVPETLAMQVTFADPDGNTVAVDFDSDRTG